MSLYLGICLFAPFSPAHFNPSVSIGFFFKKDSDLKPKNLLIYTVCQLLGALFGASLAYFIYDIDVGPYGRPGSVPVILTHIVGEIMGTCLFIFFIQMVTNEITTFINEDSWIHFFIPLSLFCGRTYFPV